MVLVRGLWPSRETRGGLLAEYELALLLCALPAALLVATIAGYRNLYIERYVIVALPFFAIALARGVTRFSRVWLRNAVACALVAVGVASYAMLLDKSTVRTVYRQNPDFRSAAQYVRAQRPDPGEVALIAMPLTYDFSYYLNSRTPGRGVEERPYSAADVEDVLAMGQIRTVVLANVQGRRRFNGVLDQFKQDRRVRLTRFQSFKEVDLYVFERP